MKQLITLLLACCAMTARAEPPLRVEAEISPAQPWVQSQTIYTLRALQSADVRDIRLVPPLMPLAEVYPLGATTLREVERKGRRYRLHERRFAILPLASGNLSLTGAHVSGRLPGAAATARWDAPPLSLQVQAVPAGIAADRWLPAHRLTLTETWSPATGALAQDGLARRTIRIEAHGVIAAQIPELIPTTAGMRVTALPPRLETRVEGEWLVAVREQEFQLLPQQPGTALSPPLQLGWWHVGTGTTVIARLPARTLDVTGVAANRTPPSPNNRSGMLPAMAALLLLLGTGVWLGRRIGRHPLWTLRRACRAGNATAARNALLLWAAARWPEAPLRSLPAVARRLAPDPRAIAAVNDLDRHLYGGTARPWPAQEVWRAALCATFTSKRGRAQFSS